MVRSVLPTFDINPHYMYLVSYQPAQTGAYVLLGQLKNLDLNITTDKKSFKRVGDPNTTDRAGSKSHEITLTQYWDNDLSELALLLGHVKPAGTSGWIGTESITLDQTLVGNIKIEGYDGTGTGAVLRSTENLTAFRPGSLKAGIDSEGDARTADIGGTLDNWTMTPAAGLGAG